MTRRGEMTWRGEPTSRISTLLASELQLLRSLATKLRFGALQREILKNSAVREAPLSAGDVILRQPRRLVISN